MFHFRRNIQGSLIVFKVLARNLCLLTEPLAQRCHSCSQQPENNNELPKIVTSCRKSKTAPEFSDRNMPSNINERTTKITWKPPVSSVKRSITMHGLCRAGVERCCSGTRSGVTKKRFRTIVNVNRTPSTHGLFDFHFSSKIIPIRVIPI